MSNAIAPAVPSRALPSRGRLAVEADIGAGELGLRAGPSHTSMRGTSSPVMRVAILAGALLSLACGSPEPAPPVSATPEPAAPAAPSAPTTLVPTIDVGELEPLSARASMVTVTRDALRVGDLTLALAEGRIAASDVRGGEHGYAVDAITRALSGDPGRVALAIEPSVPYETLARVLYSAGQASRTTFELEVEQGGRRGMVPIALPSLGADALRAEAEASALAAEAALDLANGAIAPTSPAPAAPPAPSSVRITLRASGLSVDAPSEPTCTALTAATLGACLRALRARPELRRVVLLIARDVRTSEVARTLGIVRGPADAPLFRDIELGVDP